MNFYSRRPCKERRRMPSSAKKILYFYSRHPCKERRKERLTLRRRMNISTHGTHVKSACHYQQCNGFIFDINLCIINIFI